MIDVADRYTDERPRRPRQRPRGMADYVGVDVDERNDAVETWLPVVGHEGDYEVSDQGRVRSTTRTITWRDGRVRQCAGVMLKPHTRSADGRQQVGISRAGYRRSTLVAQLVLEAFVGPRPSGLMACHNNGDTSNDHVTNLRWDTQSENLMDVQRHGHCRARNKVVCLRGHCLVVPNLQPTRLKAGYRICLACQRGCNKVNYWAKRGVCLDRQAESDEYYRAILAVPT